MSVEEVEIGRRLGHDLYRFGRASSTAALPASIAEGVLHAKACDVRQQAADIFTRKWLQLRLNAFERHRYVDEQVTPGLIKAIDVACCPVMRTVLTHGELSGTDWSIDRLNNDAAYAPSNLAVMSSAANRAKGRRSFDEVYALSQQAASAGSVEGLAPAQWLRLAALMLGPCFATRPGDAPMIPLVTPIPRFTVREACQQVQYVFTVHAVRPSGKNALIKAFDAASGTERCQTRLRFLAESVHSGLKGLASPWDVWLNPDTMQCLADWRACMDGPAWGLAGEISRRVAGGRRVSPSRLETWHLGRRGHV